MGDPEEVSASLGRHLRHGKRALKRYHEAEQSHESAIRIRNQQDQILNQLCDKAEHATEFTVETQDRAQAFERFISKKRHWRGTVNVGGENAQDHQIILAMVTEAVQEFGLDGGTRVTIVEQA